MTLPAHLQAALDQAAKEGVDMNEAQSGGGDYSPPAEGACRLRLVGYIELGKHTKEYKGESKTKDEVQLTFELSGKKHPPLDIDGKKVPLTLKVNLNKSLNEKAHYYKMFKRMNHTGDAKIFAQLLGRAFIGTITHNTVGEGDSKRIYANLNDENGFTVRSPYTEDLESGETKLVKIAEPLSPIKCFLWDYADKEQWDALFIDGSWDEKTDDAGKVIKEGKSKNFYQNKIKAADNFVGSPVEGILLGDAGLDLDDAEQPERSEEDVQAGVEQKAGAAKDELDDLDDVPF